MPPLQRRALLIRLDRIGDLILTLPVDAAFSPGHAHWWISQGLEFIADAAAPPRERTPVPAKPSLREAFALWRQIRRSKPEVAVVFHAPWWAGFLVWAARVPVRIGPKSQWHSFLFFNRAIRQKRSEATVHESEYNALLIEDGLRLERGTVPRLPLVLRAKAQPAAQRDLLSGFGLRAGGFFVVHPGMKGSALNWPPAHWERLIRQLLRKAPVAVTGTAADEAHLAPLRERLADERGVLWLDGRLSTEQLLAVLANARAVAAPSTGVLHLAASLGARAIGIYSPVLVQAARRWGPRGPDARALSPDGPCPARFACLREACPRWNCLEALSPDLALKAMLSE